MKAKATPPSVTVPLKLTLGLYEALSDAVTAVPASKKSFRSVALKLSLLALPLPWTRPYAWNRPSSLVSPY